MVLFSDDASFLSEASAGQSAVVARLLRSPLAGGTRNGELAALLPQELPLKNGQRLARGVGRDLAKAIWLQVTRKSYASLVGVFLLVLLVLLCC